MYGTNPGAIVDNVKMIQTSCVATAVDWMASATENEEGAMTLVVNLTDETNTGATYTVAYKTSEETAFVFKFCAEEKCSSKKVLGTIP